MEFVQLTITIAFPLILKIQSNELDYHLKWIQHSISFWVFPITFLSFFLFYLFRSFTQTNTGGNVSCFLLLDIVLSSLVSHRMTSAYVGGITWSFVLQSIEVLILYSVPSINLINFYLTFYVIMLSAPMILPFGISRCLQTPETRATYIILIPP